MIDRTFILEEGRVLTPDGFVEKTSVYVEDGTIKHVGKVPIDDLPAGARRIDVSGYTVLPGLIDLHVQGAGGSDLLDEEEDAVETVARSLAPLGTTAFLATTVVDTRRADQPHLSRIDHYDPAEAPGARILGIHLEGPFINPAKKGMIAEHFIGPASMGRLDEIEGYCGDGLAMMTIAPEVENALGIVEELRRRHIIAALGHTDATLEETERGILRGIDHVTHVTNAMRSFHHRDPGALGAVLMNQNLTMQIITDGVHIHPRVVEWLIHLKGPQRFALITDGIRALGLPPGTYEWTEDSQFTVGQSGAARYKDGTLIGTALSQLQLCRKLAEQTDIPLLEALRMASFYPAQVLGIADRKGSIQEGRDGDLVVCDQRLRPERVFVEGREIGGSPTASLDR
jgi:N-acetylglucosamine-6-phosphate deacetylase